MKLQDGPARPGAQLRLLSRFLPVVLAATALTLGPAPASADPGRFIADDFPVALEGEQVNEGVVFSTAVGSMACESVTFTATLSEPSETLEAEPSFSDCTFAGVKADVDTHGCILILHPGEEQEFEGAADLACGEGKAIVIEGVFGLCEAEIGSQEGLESVAYENDLEAEPPTFTIDAQVEGIAYSTKGFCGSAEYENGILSGKVLVSGELEGEGEEMPAVGVAVGPMPTVLCKVAPNGQGVCPKGEGYAGNVTGTMVAGSATLEKAIGEQVSCGKANFKGNYAVTGVGTFEELVMEGAEEELCESSLKPNEPNVKVTFKGLPYAPSWFEYKLVPGANQGVMWWGLRPALKFEMAIEGVTCKYGLSEFSGTIGLVANGQGGGPTQGFFAADFVRETIDAKCPLVLRLKLTVALKRGEDNVYIARSIAL